MGFLFDKWKPILSNFSKILYREYGRGSSTGWFLHSPFVKPIAFGSNSKLFPLNSMMKETKIFSKVLLD